MGQGHELAPIETEANLFAAALLMPQEAFRADMEWALEHQPQSFWNHLTSTYNVSLRACQLRVNRLDPAPVITGAVWLSSGKIKYVMPSSALEYAHQGIARHVWSVAKAATNRQAMHFPVRFLNAIRASICRLPASDAPSQIERYSRVPLNEIFAEVGSDISCELHLCGKDHRELSFAIHLPLLAANEL
jgi:hypothetical protein